MLWEIFMRELGSTSREDVSTVISLALRLMADWGSNRAEVRQLLALAVERGELSAQILPLWDRRWQDASSPVAAAPAIVLPAPVATAAEVLADKAAAVALPAELLACQSLIGQYRRKRGRGALYVGRQLLAAKTLCGQGKCRFATFLEQVQRGHGINRATCYMFLNFARWDLPEGLSGATMKWIVQGFPRGSAVTQTVIRVAVEERLSLEQLKSRYGALRSHGKSQERVVSELDSLLGVRQRLLAQQAALGQQLLAVDAALRRAGLPPDPT